MRASVKHVCLASVSCEPQASFTAKELREVLRLEGVRVSFPGSTLAPTDADRTEMAAARARRRVHEILVAAAAAPQPACAHPCTPHCL